MTAEETRKNEEMRKLLDTPITDNEEAMLYINSSEDWNRDLYVWATRMSKSMSHEIPMRGFTKEENLSYWTAYFAARKMSTILLNFIRGKNGQEIDADMTEEMRKICSRIAYD